VGDNVVARTTGITRHESSSLVTSTPCRGSSVAVIQGDELIGLGACDMKGSLAVMLSSRWMRRRARSK